MEKEYAQAVSTMSRLEGRDEGKLVDGLVSHLKKSGRMKLLPGILRELKRENARSEKLAPVLEVASSKEEKSAKEALKTQGVEVVNTVVNPSLIRGWRARANGLLWDHSAKRALTDIYKKITN